MIALNHALFQVFPNYYSFLLSTLSHHISLSTHIYKQFQSRSAYKYHAFSYLCWALGPWSWGCTHGYSGEYLRGLRLPFYAAAPEAFPWTILTRRWCCTFVRLSSKTLTVAGANGDVLHFDVSSVDDLFDLLGQFGLPVPLEAESALAEEVGGRAVEVLEDSDSMFKHSTLNTTNIIGLNLIRLPRKLMNLRLS